MRIRIIAMDTRRVRDFQAGGLDANGQPPERAVAQEDGLPCRHCLTDIRQGETYLVLGHRPFSAKQPYADVRSATNNCYHCCIERT
jgi:hypothetical protein